MYQTFFAAAETLTFTPINPQFRIIGDIGVVWSYYARQVKPKDGPLQTHFGRLTIAYTRAEGRWLVGAIHISRLPSGD
jgi:ketosteroid isomerase-like protein